MRGLDNIVPIKFPPLAAERFRRIDGNVQVYDRLRRRWLLLTPEEWVRQHFVEWMICAKGFSPNVMANEYGLKVNNMLRRCDTIVFGKSCQPLVVVEFKAPQVSISQRTFDQIVRYNLTLCAKYLAVSNGLQTYCCEINLEDSSYRFLSDLPDYSQISDL